MTFNHPWREVPMGNQAERFVRITQYPTWAGSWSYDKQAYETWMRQFDISNAIRSRVKGLNP